MLLFLISSLLLAFLISVDRELIPSTAEGHSYQCPRKAPGKPSLSLFKGGAPAPPKPQPIPQAPAMPPPPPPVPPPPTQTAIAADQAAQDAARQQLQKKGINSTLLAGETGGANSQGKKSLLG